MNATLSDDENDYLALTASIVLEDENLSPRSSPKSSGSHSDEEDDDDLVDLQTAYDKLLDECILIEKDNAKLKVKVRVFEKELNDLKSDKMDLFAKTKKLEFEKSEALSLVDLLKK